MTIPRRKKIIPEYNGISVEEMTIEMKGGKKTIPTNYQRWQRPKEKNHQTFKK